MRPRPPSPNTVAGIGATVSLYRLQRVPPPPPLPSSSLLSPAKWMATLRRRSFSQPLPSQTRARARKTPRKTPEAIRGRPNRRRPSHSAPNLRGPATRPIRAKTPAPFVAVRRNVWVGVEVEGRSSIRGQIHAQPICVFGGTRSKVRFVASPSSTPRLDPGSFETVPRVTNRVYLYFTLILRYDLCSSPTLTS
jgi:hypothetical protein